MDENGGKFERFKLLKKITFIFIQTEKFFCRSSLDDR